MKGISLAEIIIKIYIAGNSLFNLAEIILY